MTDCILIHYGEISLKGKNQPQFRKQLLRNIQLILKSAKIEWPIRHYRGYLSLEVPGGDSQHVPEALKRLKTVTGITWFAPAVKYDYQGLQNETVNSLLQTIRNKLIQLAKTCYIENQSFAVEVRRSDKRFPFKSVELQHEFGAAIIKNTPWEKVNLKQPDLKFSVEIQNGEAFVHTNRYQGLGGLPVNTAQKVLVMFSGGIDSPVAAYLAARRGCHIDFIHFTASHVSKDEISKSKIRQLAERLSAYTLKSTLYVVPMTYFDLAVAGKNIDFELILFRRFMARVAEQLAARIKAHALVTGDNLSQVASQTLTNIASTTRSVDIPLLQPLLTYDKEDIIGIAKQIGTYESSIEKYKDCCSLFQRNPRTVSDHQYLSQLEANVFPGYSKMIDQTLEDMFWLTYRCGKDYQK